MEVNTGEHKVFTVADSPDPQKTLESGPQSGRTENISIDNSESANSPAIIDPPKPFKSLFPERPTQNFEKSEEPFSYKVDMNNFEGKMRQLVINLLDKPVSIMREMHDTIEALKEASRKNARRLYELEFALHTTSRNNSKIDSVEEDLRIVMNRIEKAENHFTSAFKDLDTKLANELPSLLQTINAKVK